MNGGSVVSFMSLTSLSRNKEMAVAAVPIRFDTLLSKNFFTCNVSKNVA